MEFDLDQTPHPQLTYPSFSHSNTDIHLIDHSPVSAFDTTVLRIPATARRTHTLSAFPPLRPNPTILAAPEAFNAYAGYSDYSSSMPGTVSSPPANIVIDDHPPAPITQHSRSSQSPTEPGCVPTALLFSSNPTPVNTPTTSRVPSPTTSTPRTPPSATSRVSSTTLSRPASTFLLNKPFRCPKPNCNKSYKQANGLKYHMTHGSCNFAPPKDLEQVQALLASKRSAARNRSASPASSPRSPTASGTTTTSTASTSDDAYTETEVREAEKEAERRLRPFACGLGDCQRRYKNMNGLRYHYQHSGDHGAHGLALLANGTHECLSALKVAGTVTAPSSTQSSPQISRRSSQQEESSIMPSGLPAPPAPPPPPSIPVQPPLAVQSQQSYTQQQPYGAFAAQHHQQQQLAYQHQQQQQYAAQRQRLPYQAQAISVGGTQQMQSMGMYMGMEYGMAG